MTAEEASKLRIKAIQNKLSNMNLEGDLRNIFSEISLRASKGLSEYRHTVADEDCGRALRKILEDNNYIVRWHTFEPMFGKTKAILDISW